MPRNMEKFEPEEMESSKGTEPEKDGLEELEQPKEEKTEENNLGNEISEEVSDATKMTRRKFLKLSGAFAGAVIGGSKLDILKKLNKIEAPDNPEIFSDEYLIDSENSRDEAKITIKKDFSENRGYKLNIDISNQEEKCFVVVKIPSDITVYSSEGFAAGSAQYITEILDKGNHNLQLGIGLDKTFSKGELGIIISKILENKKQKTITKGYVFDYNAENNELKVFKKTD